MPAGHTAGTFSYRNNIKHMRRLSKLEQTRRALERQQAGTKTEQQNNSKDTQDPEDPVLQSYLAYVKDRRTAAKKELEGLELQEAYVQTVNCFDSLQVAILGKPPERKKSPIQESKIGER